MTKRLKRLNVRCQRCNLVNKTKNLEMELLCKTCGAWAKYRYQKLRLTKVHDRSNHKWLKIYEPIPQESEISQEQNEILEEIAA